MSFLAEYRGAPNFVVSFFNMYGAVGTCSRTDVLLCYISEYASSRRFAKSCLMGTFVFWWLPLSFGNSGWNIVTGRRWRHISFLGLKPIHMLINFSVARLIANFVQVYCLVSSRGLLRGNEGSLLCKGDLLHFLFIIADSPAMAGSFFPGLRVVIMHTWTGSFLFLGSLVDFSGHRDSFLSFELA